MKESTEMQFRLIRRMLRHLASEVDKLATVRELDIPEVDVAHEFAAALYKADDRARLLLDDSA